MALFELMPEGDIATESSAKILEWKRTSGSTDNVNASIGWDLNEFGNINQTAGDLLRIATAAYLGDRLTKRGATFSRTITIVVHVSKPGKWRLNNLHKVEEILGWLTGDEWKVKLVKSKVRSNYNQLDLRLDKVDEVILLSGGLDSFSGAVDLMNDGKTKVFVGHNDGTTATKHAQSMIEENLRVIANTLKISVPGYEKISLTQAESKRESSTRSRSFLFMSIATAMATARQSDTVIVPENGYTSINLPLNASRGGALSTRSTHPMTFKRVNDLLLSLNIDVKISNPYQLLTKGELVKKASTMVPKLFNEAVNATLSCGKLDGTYYKGGNPNFACGLCVPCIVRRASIQAAGIPDLTPYLIDTLPLESRQKLITNRSGDISAVREAIEKNVEATDIMSVGPWPTEFLIDNAVDLCNRGHAELAALKLP